MFWRSEKWFYPYIKIKKPLDYCVNDVISLCDSLVEKPSRDFERNKEQMELFNECTKEYSYLFEKLD